MTTITPEELRKRYGSKKRKKYQLLFWKNPLLIIMLMIAGFFFLKSISQSSKAYTVKLSTDRGVIMSGAPLSIQRQEFFNNFWENASNREELGSFYETQVYDDEFLNAESWLVGAKIFSKPIPKGLVSYYEQVLHN